HSKEKADTLAIYGNKGTYLNGVEITLCDTNDKKTKEAIENEFSEPLSPRKVLDRVAYIRKEFQLRTISVEGLSEDSLIIAVEKKSAATLEFPSITLESLEGLNFFSEMRIRRIRRFADLSPYINYTQNFPMKDTRELPKGHGFKVGVERCRSFSFIPDVNLSWRKLKFSSEIDTSFYDKEFEEISSHIALPMYNGDFAFIPGFEVAKVATNMINEEREWQGQFDGVLWMRYDNLDRFVFPESGWKADIDARVGIKTNSWTDSWMRARVRLLGVPIRFRIQNKVMSILTMRLFGSWYSEKTPYHECYSLGGFTPIGSYQLRLLDYEDLPGYVRNEFIKPIMWKAGGSARIVPMEMKILGLRANVYLEGSIYIADAIQRGEDLFVWDRKKVSQAVGLYLDTSFLNIGLVFKGTDRKFLNHFHLSVVLYGFGF
ncbi:hypothetical protein KAX29_02440, partial [candidate division WOR-3 bacterium]|nr:hypothetical protein [candidate division WOR-3 bacterium]